MVAVVASAITESRPLLHRLVKRSGSLPGAARSGTWKAARTASGRSPIAKRPVSASALASRRQNTTERKPSAWCMVSRIMRSTSLSRKPSLAIVSVMAGCRLELLRRLGGLVVVGGVAGVGGA